MKNARGDGRTLEFTAAAAHTSGDGLKIGTLVGVVVDTVASGAQGVLLTEGVFNLPKLSTAVVTKGLSLYWDAANSRLTNVATANQYAGKAWSDAGSGVLTVDVKLDQKNVAG